MFCALLFHVCLASCLSGLLVQRPLKSWTAERWIDHRAWLIRMAWRTCLFMGCVLLPFSLVYVFGSIAAHFLSSVIPTATLAWALLAMVLAVPPRLAYLFYRLLVRAVRSGDLIAGWRWSSPRSPGNTL